MRRKIALDLAVLMLLALLPCAAAAQENSPHPRMITVYGTGEIDVPPEEVLLTNTVEFRDRILVTAKSQHDAAIKKVISLAHAAGIDQKDIQTDSVRMAPQYSYDYERAPHFLAYVVSQTVEITLRDLSRYESLVTSLLEGGVEQMQRVDFRVKDSRRYRDEARAKALRAAREKAIAMAAELGQTVGRPWEITELNEGNPFAGTWALNSNSITSAPDNAGGGAQFGDGEHTVAPGQVIIRASVKVSFQLE